MQLFRQMRPMSHIFVRSFSTKKSRCGREHTVHDNLLISKRSNFHRSFESNCRVPIEVFLGLWKIDAAFPSDASHEAGFCSVIFYKEALLKWERVDWLHASSVQYANMTFSRPTQPDIDVLEINTTFSRSTIPYFRSVTFFKEALVKWERVDWLHASSVKYAKQNAARQATRNSLGQKHIRQSTNF